MNIVIPFQGRVQTVIRSSFLAAKRQTETQYQLTGEAFQMTGITNAQVVILPDTINVVEGQELDTDLLMEALPLESFVSVSAEEALPNVLGLLLRQAVEDGRITDEELLSVQPALDGRHWRAGLNVKAGDVYSHNNSLWRCLQPHTTQSGWEPDLVPVLWRKVEVVHEEAVRVWATGIDYIIDDEVSYPNEEGKKYICVLGHTSQEGWEPSAATTLWREVTTNEV